MANKKLLKVTKPTKPVSAMTDEELDAFADLLFEQDKQEYLKERKP